MHVTSIGLALALHACTATYEIYVVVVRPSVPSGFQIP
jgi:hypothetical protein